MDAATWTHTFGKTPRDVQVEAYEWWRGNNEKISIIEVPTGGGKSLLGTWILYNSKGRGIYVCPSKHLQSQLMTESKTWPGFKGRIVCLYGKRNYWCEVKKNKVLRSNAANQQLLKQVLQAAVDAWEADDTQAPMDLFFDECYQHNIPKDQHDKLWKKVAMPCSCCQNLRKHMQGEGADQASIDAAIATQGCEYDKRRYKARNCKLFIVNADLFFAYLKHTDEINLEEDPIVIDEGHLLHEKGEKALIGDDRPVDLDVWQAHQLTERYRGSRPIGSTMQPLVNSYGRKDQLVFDNNQACDALNDWTPTLDAKALARVVQFLRIAVKYGLVRGAAVQTLREEEEEEAEDDDTEGVSETERGLEFVELWGAVVKKHVPPPFVDILLPAAANGAGSRVCLATDAQLQEIVLGAVREAGATDAVYHQIADLMDAVPEANNFVAIFKELKAILTMYASIEVASAAARGDRATQRIQTWIQEENLKYYVPTLSANNKMIEYAPTFEIIAQRLHEMLWSKVRTRVVIMSATMANAQKPQNPFGLFKMQMGIERSKEKIMRQVFDRNLVRIVAPEMRKWKDACDGTKFGKRTWDTMREEFSVFTKDDFRRRQIEEISKLIAAVQRAGKSVLVLGPSSNEEADELHALLRGQGGLDHVHAKKQYRAFKEFCNDEDSEPTVVYGGKTEAIGLNVPGRLRGTVITRPPNPRYMETRIQYHLKRGIKEKYDELYNFYRDQLSLQAAGRIQRSPTDKGILLILGEPSERNDRFMLISDMIHRAWNQGEDNKPIRAVDWDTLDLETFLV